MLLNPEKHQLQSKCLTIAFWDLSGFSDMCNRLIDDPSTIVDFLKKYFNEANKIIHKNDGILDKFIGDGVMAYFGYYNNAGNQAEINAINAAIDMALEPKIPSPGNIVLRDITLTYTAVDLNSCLYL
jgi:class 3 adenylate cyclase